MIDYPDGFSNEWRNYMTSDKTKMEKRDYDWAMRHYGKNPTKETYDKATDPDAGLKLYDTEEAFTLDFTSKKREGFTSTTDHAMRHEMQRMADKINELEKRINELEKPIELIEE